MNISKHIIDKDASILDALRQLNATTNFTLFVVDENKKVVGAVTDGDIRRGLIAGASMNDAIYSICHKSFRYIDDKVKDTPSLFNEIKKSGITLVPYLDDCGCIKKLIDLRHTNALLPIDAVLMAGGRGERLSPLTDNCPKPLLPLGGKPIIEHNIDRILSFGISNITLSVRYLSNQLKEYFGDGTQLGASINYVEENSPLGTIGSVSLIEEFHNDTVLVMNSDLFTNIDLEEFYTHFIEAGADMSIASIPYNVSVPYAVMEFDGDKVKSLVEKPTYTYYSNAGIYLIKKSVLQQLEYGKHCDATDLMQRLIDKGDKVTSFPIVGYWIDIGRHEDYKKAQEFIKYVKR